MSISILLADDSITIQKVIGIIFGGEDYLLTVVDNGKAAVDKAIEINPDVLLIDALMPGMSGYEVCEHVRATPALAHKPILLLTGSFEPFDEEKAKTCGADDFLSKPFESQQIVSKVKELFELGASRVAKATVEKVSEPVFAATPPPLPQEPVFASNVGSAAAPNDIWGAFTSPVKDAFEVPADEPVNVSEPDVFAIINEEPEVKIETPSGFEPTQTENIGSKWIPTDEHTFEFEEETLAELPSGILSEPVRNDQEVSFSELSFSGVKAESKPADISFEHASDSAYTQTSAFNTAAMPEILESIPAFEEPSNQDFVRSAALSVSHPGPSTETAVPVFEPPASTLVEAAAVPAKECASVEKVDTAPLVLTEDQLKAAIASVSKEVIERIVWEVVPDLAEAIIKDAIRRIKEGQ